MAMAEIRLYDSTICRLCAEENDNGEMLFTDDSEETDLSGMINRYLPLKVYNDGNLPRTICPGCNIQLEATVQFFQLLVNGQNKIREMWKQQVELDKAEMTRDDDEFFIDVIPDGPIYASEHDLSLQMEGLDKPRKKRGRPPKELSDQDFKEINVNDLSQDMEEQESCDQEYEGDGRARRKRKVPKRYMESVQGKELDKILKEEGVFDDDGASIKQEVNEHTITALESNNSDTEIIGHMETVEGKSLNEFVVINKNKTKSKPLKSKTKRKLEFICSLCGKGFLQRSKFLTHKSLHNIQYECSGCKSLFLNQEELAIHQKAVDHSGERSVKFKSDIAPMSTPNENYKIETNSIDEKTDDNQIENDEKNLIQVSTCQGLEKSQEGDYKCNKCNKHFESQDAWSSHIKVVHEGEKPFLCEICLKTFAYESSLKGHQEMYHQTNKTEKGFPCDVCGKVLNHPSSVMYHKSTEHNGRRFICNKCGKSFKHKQLLQRHQLVHSEDRPYPCKSCSASFKTKANLLNHQSTHTGERKHACDMCNQKFAHKTSLTLHYRTHTGQKPYKCEICSKCFSQNGNLQEHMRIHTGEKPYCCDHCGRKFTTSSQFKLHVKRHTGERPWKCDKCTKSFLHKDTWKCHVRRHNGERPFVCSHCSRGFTEQWALKKHLRLHTGEKPYSCEICGKAFADCSNLTKHKKVHKKVSESQEFLSQGMWQILPNTPETNAISNITELMAADQVSEDGMPQIVYVAYQDAENSNEPTLQSDQDDTLIDHEPSVNNHLDEQDPIQTSADLQLQLTDQDGIPLSMQAARQLLAGGQYQLNGNQISISGIGIPSDVEDIDQENSASEMSSTIQADAQAIVQVLEDDDDDDGTTSVANMDEIDPDDRVQLSQQTLEFITENGHKVRLVPALTINSSEYLIK